MILLNNKWKKKYIGFHLHFLVVKSNVESNVHSEYDTLNINKNVIKQSRSNSFLRKESTRLSEIA
jgi:hypothetical protein